MKQLPYTKVTRSIDQLVFLGNEKGLDIFEENYLKVRQKEGRLFSDQLVEQLPYLPQAHPLRSEWLHRATTAGMFVKYLKLKKEFNTLLDLGCGNGWFTRQIATVLPKADVYGLDVNANELHQAARLYSGPQTSFLYGDVFQDIFTPGTFNLIVLNSSVQYFPDIKRLIQKLLKLLTEHGEIHIIDSPIYTSKEQQNEAKKRSDNYFRKIEAGDMSQHYYHHAFSALQGFSYAVLYRPERIKNAILSKLGKRPALFPWVRIRKN